MIAGSVMDALVGEYEIALLPQSETSFLLGPLNGKVTFEKDEQGRGKKLTLEQGGRPTTADRRP